MGGFNFIGDLENIQPRQLDFISEVLEKRGFNGPDANIENVGKAGDNYIANVKRVSVSENGRTFKMIAKLAPDVVMLRHMFQLEMLFTNEITIYTDLFPKYVEIQKNAGVTELFRFAECYGCLDEAPNEVILLEDLKESQFDLLDRFKPLSNDSVKLALKNFAIFHSLSYVLKHQEQETFDRIKSKFGDMFSGPMSQSEDGRRYFQQLEDTTLGMMTDDKYKKYLTKSIGDVYNIYAKTTKADRDSKYSVIMQGDGWTNNIMFRSKDDVPVECVLIDYQMVKESNPAFDLMYMIFNSTSHEQRLKHYYEFLDYYHKELDKSLHNYGLKASFVFPRDQLDCDFKRYGKLMLAMNILVSNSILKKSEDAEKIKDMMNSATMDNINVAMEGMLHMDPETVALVKAKIEGLVDSFVEFEYL